MTLLVAAAVALVGTWGLWRVTHSVFERPVFLRENVRGRMVPVGVGMLIAVAASLGAAVMAIVEASGLDIDVDARAAANATLICVLGFALLGLLDDLAQDRGVSGYRGHLASIGRAELSAGAVKLLGGGLIAIIAVAPGADGSLLRLLLDAALVALAANLANLFDRAPGRVCKLTVVSGIGIIAATGAAASTIGVAFVTAATLGLGPADLRERLMLGDAGANAIGAALGLGVVLSCTPLTRVVVLIVLLALNLLSEVVSFSAVIRRTPPLRLLDEWGRELP